MEGAEELPCLFQQDEDVQDCLHASTEAALSLPSNLQQDVSSSCLLQPPQAEESSAPVKCEENTSQGSEHDSDEELSNCSVYFQTTEKQRASHSGVEQHWVILDMLQNENAKELENLDMKKERRAQESGKPFPCEVPFSSSSRLVARANIQSSSLSASRTVMSDVEKGLVSISQPPASGNLPMLSVSTSSSSSTYLKTAVMNMANISSSVVPMPVSGDSLRFQSCTWQKNASSLQQGPQFVVNTAAPWLCLPSVGGGGNLSSPSACSRGVGVLPSSAPSLAADAGVTVVTRSVPSVSSAVLSVVSSVAATPVSNMVVTPASNVTPVSNIVVAPINNMVVTPASNVTPVSNIVVAPINNMVVTPASNVTPVSNIVVAPISNVTPVSNITAAAMHVSNPTAPSLITMPTAIVNTVTTTLANRNLPHRAAVLNNTHTQPAKSTRAASINSCAKMRIRKIAAKPDITKMSKNGGLDSGARTQEDMMAASSMCALGSPPTAGVPCVQLMSLGKVAVPLGSITNVNSSQIQTQGNSVVMSQSLSSSPLVMSLPSPQTVGIINNSANMVNTPQFVICNLTALPCETSATCTKLITAQKRRGRRHKAPVSSSHYKRRAKARARGGSSEEGTRSESSSGEDEIMAAGSFSCGQSRKTFKSRGSLTKHMFAEHGSSAGSLQREKRKVQGKSVRSHNDDAWKCLTCDEVLTSWRALVAHRSMHRNKRRHVCKECNRRFSSASKLQRHQNLHSGVKAFSCQQCLKRFRSSVSLNDHYKIAHADVSPHLCSVCKKTFETSDALRRHQCVHKALTLHTCSVCKQSFESDDLLKKHSCVQTDQSYVCNVCKSIFETSDSLKKHSCGPTEEKRFACDKCDKVFKYAMSLSFHKKEHAHQERSRKTLRPRKNAKIGKRSVAKAAEVEKGCMCHICGKVLANRFSLQAHEVTHSDTKPFNCSTCQQGFNSRSQLERHEHKHTGVKPFPCDKCQKRFTSRIGLRNHYRTIHLNRRPFVCDVCKKSFSAKNVLEAHKKIHSDERPFSCEECGCTFKHAGSLKCHKLLHVNKRPFKCDQCGKSYVTANSLSKHTKTHAKPQCVCDVCGKAFYFSDQLNRHKEAHAEVKPSVCNICNKAFATERSLQKHQQTHNTDRVFKCEICEKGFRSYSGCLKHKVTHSSVKPYSCDVCQKTFKRSDSLRVHRDAHFSEKKFVCDQCGLAYHNENSLKMHQKLKHLDCEKPFVCKVCNKGYQFQSYLKEHERVHSNEKTLVCKICNKAVKYHLERHMKLHHST